MSVTDGKLWRDPSGTALIAETDRVPPYPQEDAGLSGHAPAKGQCRVRIPQNGTPYLIWMTWTPVLFIHRSSAGALFEVCHYTSYSGLRINMPSAVEPIICLLFHVGGRVSFGEGIHVDDVHARRFCQWYRKTTVRPSTWLPFCTYILRKFIARFFLITAIAL